MQAAMLKGQSLNAQVVWKGTVPGMATRMRPAAKQNAMLPKKRQETATLVIANVRIAQIGK